MPSDTCRGKALRSSPLVTGVAHSRQFQLLSILKARTGASKEIATIVESLTRVLVQAAGL